MSDVQVTIEGIQEAQDKNIRKIAALQPSGALGQAVQIAGLGLHRYAVMITHVDTGALKAAHRIELSKTSKAEGRIYIDPNAVNPHGKRPAAYGQHEHARGGSHAFYTRTAKEAGPNLVNQVIAYIRARFRSA